MAITIDVVEKIGVVGQRKQNTVELRIVSWNRKPPKYDLRGWYMYNGEERCAKGITFSEEEAKALFEILETIDPEDEEFKVFGKAGSITVQLNRYGYDFGVYNGTFRTKGITLTAEEVITFHDLLEVRWTAKPKLESVTKPEKPKAKAPAKENVEEMDSVVKSLISIPVNDGNYPLQKATFEQLREAIRLMEAKPEGNKTRLARCKAKLKTLERAKSPDVKPQEAPKAKPAPAPAKEVAKEVAKAPIEKPEKTKERGVVIIQFAEAKAKRLAATNEGHSFEECKAKLEAEKKEYKDFSSIWLIDEVIKACKEDAELRDNVMRSDKSYAEGFKYIAEKARQGSKGAGIVAMDSETALKYILEYFGVDTTKPEPKKKTAAEFEAERKAMAAKEKAVRAKAETKKVNAPKRGGWKK